MDLRKPYIRLCIVLGLISWIKDYQKLSESYWKASWNFPKITGSCPIFEDTDKNRDSINHSFYFPQQPPILPNHTIYEK